MPLKRLFAFCFLIIGILLIPQSAWACFRKPLLPVKNCADTELKTSEFYRVNDLYFKIPNEFVSRGHVFPLHPLNLLEQDGSVKMHVMMDTFKPTCSYVRQQEELKDTIELSSLYHHYKGLFLTTSCRRDVDAGPYIQSFMTKAAIVNLRRKPNAPAGEERYYRDPREAFEYPKKIKERINSEPDFLLKNIRDFDAYLLSRPEELIEKGRKWAFDTRERGKVVWEWVKRIHFRSHSSEPFPIYLQCSYRYGVEKVTIPDTLSEYETCLLYFLTDKLRIEVTLHGAQIGFDGQELDIMPMIYKVKDFVERFEIPANDPELLAELARRKNQNGEDIIAGKFGDPVLAAALQGRIVVLQKLIESGADVNKGKALGHTLASHPGTTDLTVRYQIAKLLLEHGAFVQNEVPIRESVFKTTICRAVSTRKTKFVALVLKYGAKPNIEGYGSALHCEAYNGKDLDYQMLQILLDAGADPYLKNDKEKTILDYIHESERPHFDAWLKTNHIDSGRLQSRP